MNPDPIGQFCSYAEATTSQTATRLGIDNTPNTVQLAAMKLVYKKCMEPARMALGRLRVSSFYRSPELNKAIGGSANSQHCFDTETQMLTPSGWVSAEDMSVGMELFGFNTETSLIEVTKINEVIFHNYSGSMIKGNSLLADFVVTDKHRMLTSTTSANRSNRYVFEEARNTVGKRRLYPVSGYSTGTMQCENIDLYKFCMAAIADGCLCKNKAQKNYDIKFILKKERKIQEIENLLNSLGWPYRKRYCESRHKQGQFGVYEISIKSSIGVQVTEIIGLKKYIPLLILKMPANQIRELLLTYARFDGYFDKRPGNTGISISSISKRNIDTLQAMATLCGYRNTVSIHNPKTGYPNAKTCYTISLSPNTETRLNETSVSEFNFEGLVWCVKNDLGTLITRRNGKIIISGNCKGEAIDLQGNDNKALFEWLKKNVEFDQIISEFPDANGVPAWVHISYSASGNRKQVLKASKVDGKTVYSKI